MSGIVLDTKGTALGLCWGKKKRTFVMAVTAYHLSCWDTVITFSFSMYDRYVGGEGIAFFLLGKKIWIIYAIQGKRAMFACHLNTEKELAFLDFFYQFIPLWKSYAVGKHSITLTDSSITIPSPRYSCLLDRSFVSWSLLSLLPSCNHTFLRTNDLLYECTLDS